MTESIRNKLLLTLRRRLPSKRSSPASSGAVVLCYHHVGSSFPEFTDQLGITTPLEELYSDLVFLRRHFKVVSLEHLASSPHREELVALTFDDGYKSVLREALPLLEEFQIPVALYVNYGAVKGRITWLNKLNALLRSLSESQLSILYERALGEKLSAGSARKVQPYIKKFLFPCTINAIETSYAEHFSAPPPPDLFMSEADIMLAKDHPLITWGSHSFNHYPLHRLPHETISEELREGHSALSSLLEERLQGCALPFGSAILRQHNEVVQAVSSIDQYFISCTGEQNPGLHIGDLREIRRFPGPQGMSFLRRRLQGHL